MDVGCPQCKTEYELDDGRVGEDGVTVKCTTCGHVFRVKKKQLVVTLPARGDSGPATPLSPSASSPDLPPAPPLREWKIRQAAGNVFACRDLTMLQKWIIEGKVVRDDEISLSGETWKRLGNIPELASFFQIVEDAAKARALEAMARVAPAPTPVVPPPKITDTWRGGQFSGPAPERPATPEDQTIPFTSGASATQRRDTPPDEQAARGEPPAPEASKRHDKTLQGGRFGDGPPTVPPPAETKKPARAPTPPPAEKAPPLTETLKGGRFAEPAPMLSKPLPPEPSDAELERAVKGGGGGGKWAALVILGLGVGGALGWYFGVHEPQQRKAQEQLEASQREAARLAALKPPEPLPVVVLDASVEDDEPDAGAVAVADAGAPAIDAGPEPVVDAGAPAPEPVDAGAAAPPVVVEQKRSFDWYIAQGDRLRDREKPEQSLDLYAKAEELKPDRAESYAGRGLALLDMANPSDAIVAFQEALKRAPRYGPAIMGMAEAYRAAGNNAKAIQFYERYLDVLPNGSEAPVARNSIERLKGQ